MGRRRRRKSVAGLIIAIALLGFVLVVAARYSGGAPEPIEVVEGYDDNWGKLDAPASEAVATDILLTWRESAAEEAQIHRDRTREQAREIAEELWEKYRADRTDANWLQLLEQHSDRSRFPDAKRRYPPANVRQRMPEEFYQVARTTRVGFARIAESEQGVHLIRREPLTE